MLIWVSYSVNSHHVVAVVLQEASLKMGPNQSPKCSVFQYVQWRRSGSEFECCAPTWDPYRMAWLFCILCSVQMWLHSLFRNLSWHWREGDLVTSSQFKNSLLLYAVQTVEKMLDRFIGDSIRGMSIMQKSVWRLVCYISWNICLWCDIHAFWMQSDMATVQGAFLDNVGASEALVQLPPTHEVEPTVTWMGSPPC